MILNCCRWPPCNHCEERSKVGMEEPVSKCVSMADLPDVQFSIFYNCTFLPWGGTKFHIIMIMSWYWLYPVPTSITSNSSGSGFTELPYWLWSLNKYRGGWYSVIWLYKPAIANWTWFLALSVKGPLACYHDRRNFEVSPIIWVPLAPSGHM